MAMIGAGNFNLRSHAMRGGDSLSGTVSSGRHSKEINPYNELFPLAACRTGNLGWLKKELSNDTSIVNQPFRSGRTGDFITLLYVACQEGHEKVVSLLLDRGADPDGVRSLDGATPLGIACQKGHEKVVSLLLDRGADPGRGRSLDGATPLIMASNQGHAEVVRLLLARGADPESRAHGGTTPLIEASGQGHAEVASLLIDKGADPNSSRHDGEMPLTMASGRGHAEVVRLLLDKGVNPDSSALDGATALYMASQNGHAQVVSLLLNARADPRKKWKINRFLTKSPIQAAKKDNHKAIVKMLRKSLSARKKRSEPVTERTPLLQEHYENRWYTV